MSNNALTKNAANASGWCVEMDNATASPEGQSALAGAQPRLLPIGSQAAAE